MHNFSFPLSLKILKLNLQMLSVELHYALGKVETLEKEMSVLNKEREDLLARVKELDTGLELQNDFQVPYTNALFVEGTCNKKKKRGKTWSR